MGHGQRPPDPRPLGTPLWIATIVAAAATVVCVLGACSAASPRSQMARTPSSPAWLLTRSALSQIAADPAVRDKLSGARVYEILQPSQQPLAQVAAKSVVIFASATALKAAVRGGQLPTGTYGVLYDPEAWSFTPVAEQQDPTQAATGAAAAAHAHGLRLIVAPALNLTKVLKPTSGEARWRQFLELNLVGRLARIADVIELQAQSLERDTATYSAFVRAAASQARVANPRINVLAGLSTNPPGVPVDSQQLTAAIRATESMVDGYWLNIPGQGPRCLTCNLPNPDIAIRTLQALQ
jgi:hypothetical protein